MAWPFKGVDPLAGGNVVEGDMARFREVEVNIGDDVYLDVERDFAAAIARE